MAKVGNLKSKNPARKRVASVGKGFAKTEMSHHKYKGPRGKRGRKR